jgi:uncharacterized protein (TIGR03435 family)
MVFNPLNPRNMKPLVYLFVLFGCFTLKAQTSTLIDKPAPELTFSKILNDASPNSKLSDYKSKVVILDFWATWCAPCIESFSHLEELQKKFGQDVKILAVTDETEERITKFLQKRNLTLAVVIDADRKVAEKFPHQSIPHTVVIDKTGVTRVIALPKTITAETIEKIIGGQPVDIAEKSDRMNFDPSRPLSGNENFTYQVTVTPYQNGIPSMSNPTGGNGGYKNRRIVCTNMAPKSMFEVAWQFPVGIRTIVEVKNRKEFDWSTQTAFCFDLIVPAELGEKRFDIMKQHLDLLLPYKPVVEKRERKVKVLKIIEGQKPSLKPAAGGTLNYAYGGRGLSMKNGDVKKIAEFLESQLNIPVVEETKLPGLYDTELDWYNEDPTRIFGELKKIGLELVDATRPIDVLVIYDKN